MDIDFWNINAETAKPFGKAKKYITVKEIMEAKEKIKLHEKITELFALIPKEHHKNVNKLNAIFRQFGAEDVLEIVGQLKDIDSKNARDYCVTHESCIDGG